MQRDGGHWAPSPVAALVAAISLGLVGNLAAGTVQVRQWWWPPLAWAGTALLALASLGIEWTRNRAERAVTPVEAREAPPAAQPDQPQRSGRGERPPARALTPAEDLRGLDDDQVRVLRSCAAALSSLLAVADTAGRTSRFSPSFADATANVEYELSRAGSALLALKGSVGLATWPDAGLAAQLITARDNAQRDVEAAQGHQGAPGAVGQGSRRFRQSAGALQALLRQHYPSLFTAPP